MSGVLSREVALPLGAMIGYALLMATNPVRHALLDGARALRRYKRLWTIPAGLGLCYAVFRAGVTLFFYTVLPLEQLPAFGWRFAWVMTPWAAHLHEAHSVGDWLGALWADPHMQWIARAGGLDGIEAVAGLFNSVVTTFPLSAAAGVLLLANWEGHHVTLRNALRKRFRRWAWAAHGGILVCAVSAIVAPFLFGPSLIYLNRVAPGLVILRWSALVDWLSSLFAYLFGLGVQVYMILIVYTWLRGLNWTPVHLMDLAIRRFSHVVKWGAIVMGVSSVLIDLPRIFALLFRYQDPRYFGETLGYIDFVARPVLACLLIFFGTMQVTLTFHSETLRQALGHHWHIVGRYWWQIGWYLVIAGVHLFGFAFFNRWLLMGFGEATSAEMIWSFLRPLFAALLAAWLLASWVSLYKRFETGRVGTADLIPF